MNQKKILLVEDDPDDEMLISMSLQRSNIANELAVARDGQEALDYLFAQGAHAGRDLADSPAVVLLDLHLPKVDGLEVLRRIRADPRTRTQPVVVLTSSDEQRDRLKSYDLGVNSYVCKPVEFDQFSGAVKSLGLYWLLLNKPPKD
ncbi:MAG: response regulator [Elusimicrobia bacterium]|nr:response regulator [Elusimicrobiota bacterium]